MSASAGNAQSPVATEFTPVAGSTLPHRATSFKPLRPMARSLSAHPRQGDSWGNLHIGQHTTAHTAADVCTKLGASAVDDAAHDPRLYCNIILKSTLAYAEAVEGFQGLEQAAEEIWSCTYSKPDDMADDIKKIADHAKLDNGRQQSKVEHSEAVNRAATFQTAFTEAIHNVKPATDAILQGLGAEAAIKQLDVMIAKREAPRGSELFRAQLPHESRAEHRQCMSHAQHMYARKLLQDPKQHTNKATGSEFPIYIPLKLWCDSSKPSASKGLKRNRDEVTDPSFSNDLGDLFEPPFDASMSNILPAGLDYNESAPSGPARDEPMDGEATPDTPVSNQSSSAESGSDDDEEAEEDEAEEAAEDDCEYHHLSRDRTLAKAIRQDKPPPGDLEAEPRVDDESFQRLCHLMERNNQATDAEFPEIRQELVFCKNWGGVKVHHCFYVEFKGGIRHRSAKAAGKEWKEWKQRTDAAQADSEMAPANTAAAADAPSLECDMPTGVAATTGATAAGQTRISSRTRAQTIRLRQSAVQLEPAGQLRQSVHQHKDAVSADQHIQQRQTAHKRSTLQPQAEQEVFSSFDGGAVDGVTAAPNTHADAPAQSNIARCFTAASNVAKTNKAAGTASAVADALDDVAVPAVPQGVPATAEAVGPREVAGGGVPGSVAQQAKEVEDPMTYIRMGLQILHTQLASIRQKARFNESKVLKDRTFFDVVREHTEASADEEDKGYARKVQKCLAQAEAELACLKEQEDRLAGAAAQLEQVSAMLGGG